LGPIAKSERTSSAIGIPGRLTPSQLSRMNTASGSGTTTKLPKQPPSELVLMGERGQPAGVTKVPAFISSISSRVCTEGTESRKPKSLYFSKFQQQPRPLK
jgi:hypothetical protein